MCKLATSGFLAKPGLRPVPGPSEKVGVSTIIWGRAGTGGALPGRWPQSLNMLACPSRQVWGEAPRREKQSSREKEGEHFAASLSQTWLPGHRVFLSVVGPDFRVIVLFLSVVGWTVSYTAVGTLNSWYSVWASRHTLITARKGYGGITEIANHLMYIIWLVNKQMNAQVFKKLNIKYICTKAASTFL